ncbi:hypothetical protein FGG08_001122 [Glutinoglossum americanum]|uniref:Fungal N-terminal domain-containing protein n=1 Tax=Glutinoglossum americanum TaxID=1670608 RepID=A0A9P8L5J6_9PEZI|nr:hypothetical protein FGG08_001122 [Glutinoglossum americanum]
MKSKMAGGLQDEGLGDFLVLVKVVTDLQQTCELVTRDAPGDFQTLVGDLSTLVGVMTRIKDDLQRPGSTLAKQGEQRLLLLGTVSKTLEHTLKKFKRVVDRYKHLVSGNGVRGLWSRVQWMAEQAQIKKIRVDLGFSIASLQLVMASIGDSSLRRLEDSLQRLHVSVTSLASHPEQTDNTPTPDPDISGNDSDSTSSSADEHTVKASQTRELPWAELRPDDRTAVLEVLMRNCQAAFYRFCDEQDIIGSKYHCFDNITGPTDISFLHWIRKLNRESAREQFVEDATTFHSDLRNCGEKIAKAAEKRIDFDKSEALEYVDCARVILNQIKGWQWVRQADEIRSAIENDRVCMLEIKRRGHGWTLKDEVEYLQPLQEKMIRKRKRTL